MTLGRPAIASGLRPIDLIEIEPEFARAIAAPAVRSYFARFLAGGSRAPESRRGSATPGLSSPDPSRRGAGTRS